MEPLPHLSRTRVTPRESNNGAESLLEELAGRGVVLWASGDRMRWNAHGVRVGVEDVRRIKRHEADLCRILAREDGSGALPHVRPPRVVRYTVKVPGTDPDGPEAA